VSLGQYLVEQGVIDAAVLHEALELQKTLQGSMHSLLERAGIVVSSYDEVLEASAV
jgi:hypothetical protein